MKKGIQPQMKGVAIVGCGRISKHHIDAIGRVDGIEVAAVCDAIASRAAEAGTALGSLGSPRSRRWSLRPPFDIVSICTPSGSHPDHGEIAARAGKHVITEKPMAVTLETADRLIRACDEMGVRLFRVKQNRLNPSIQLVNSAIDKKRFGKIYIANVTVRWQRPQEYYDAESWRGTWANDGGAFMKLASHYVDLIQWLVGPVESVMAKTATQARNIEAQDSGAAVLSFASGALGVIEVNVITHPETSRLVDNYWRDRHREDWRHCGE